MLAGRGSTFSRAWLKNQKSRGNIHTECIQALPMLQLPRVNWERGQLDQRKLPKAPECIWTSCEDWSPQTWALPGSKSLASNIGRAGPRAENQVGPQTISEGGLYLSGLCEPVHREVYLLRQTQPVCSSWSKWQMPTGWIETYFSVFGQLFGLIKQTHFQTHLSQLFLNCHWILIQPSLMITKEWHCSFSMFLKFLPLM